MPHVQASDLAREAEAILKADLMTCACCTLDGLKVTAIHALQAVYPEQQRVTIQRGASLDQELTVRVDGPQFHGTITMLAAGYD